MARGEGNQERSAEGALILVHKARLLTVHMKQNHSFVFEKTGKRLLWSQNRPALLETKW